MEDALDLSPEGRTPLDILIAIEDSDYRMPFGFGRVWTSRETRYVSGLCPTCKGKPPHGTVCLICHSTAIRPAEVPQQAKPPRKGRRVRKDA